MDGGLLCVLEFKILGCEFLSRLSLLMGLAQQGIIFIFSAAIGDGHGSLLMTEDGFLIDGSGMGTEAADRLDVFTEQHENIGPSFDLR